MWSWLKKKSKICTLCRKNHDITGVPVGDSTPIPIPSITGGFYHNQLIYPGHEYIVFASNGETRPESCRVGFLRSHEDEYGDISLVFSAANEHQDDETITIIIMSSNIISVREVHAKRNARYASRNYIREIKL